MDDLALLIDLHGDGARQGPGSPEQTRRAIELAGLDRRPDLRIADLGCGTGAATLQLAALQGAQVTALDLVQPFLDRLEQAARAAGLDARVRTLCASMDAPPLPACSLDAIWSEGAIYNIGFAQGLKAWQPLLAPGGVLAVSDLTWLGRDRPDPLTEHWTRAYPGVDTAAARLALIEAEGLAPVGYFVLPPEAWLAQYYRPLAARFDAFLHRHGHSDAARALVAAEKAEIALYERYSAHVSYGFYIARKPGG